MTVEFKEKYTPKIDRDIVALANARGGFVVLGVNDEGKIVGETLTNQMKAEILSLARNCDPHIAIPRISQIENVVIIEVSEGDAKPYSCSSGYFRRLDAVTQKMTQQEVRLIFRQSADVFFEDLPRDDFTLGDISLQKVRAFLKEAGTSYKLNKTNLPSLLASLGIYKNETINNAGVMIFAADVKKWVPYCEIIFGAFKGTDKMHIYDRKDVRDDLLIQLNEAIEFFKKHLNIRSEIREFNRRDIYEIPLDALREALVNALVHRDYSMRGTSIYVNVFDDRVEITNPGGLPAGITRDNFGKESVRRNQIIADLFHRMGKVERMGTGIKRMCDLIRDAGLKQPDFTSDTFFHAVFYRDPKYALKKVSGMAGEISRETIRKTREKTREKILSLLRKEPNLTIAELAANTGITNKGIEWQLNRLCKEVRLRRIGPDKGGHWEIVGKNNGG